MEIKEKAKKFVKEHKKGLIVAGGILGSVAIAGIGYTLGERSISAIIKNYTGIDFTRDFAYSVKDGILSDYYREDEISDVLKNCGFTSLDEPVKMAAFIQK